MSETEGKEKNKKGEDDNILSPGEISNLENISWDDIQSDLDKNKQLVLETDGKETDMVIGDAAGMKSAEDVDLNFLLDVPLKLTVEVGRKRLNIGNVLDIRAKSILELNNPIGRPLSIFVNSTLIGYGVIVIKNQKFGIKIVNLIPEEERIKYIQSEAMKR